MRSGRVAVVAAGALALIAAAGLPFIFLRMDRHLDVESSARAVVEEAGLPALPHAGWQPDVFAAPPFAVAIDDDGAAEVDLHPPSVAVRVAELTSPARPIPMPDLHPPEVVPAKDIVPVEGPSLPGVEAGPAKTADRGMPETLPSTESTAPLEPKRQARSHSSDSLEALIAREMPHSTDEERKIWLDEMKGLNPATVRDLLRLRRNVQDDENANRVTEDGADAKPPRIGSRPERIPLPEWPRRLTPPEESAAENGPVESMPPFPELDGSAVVGSALIAATKARLAILQNLANARTPGYRRNLVAFTELRSPDEVLFDSESGDPVATEAAVLGADANAGLIDLRPGPIVATGRALDVAIDGEGFFAVQSRNEARFTRCGRLTLDGRHRLCVKVGGAALPLAPEITLDENAGAIRIGEDGSVDIQVADRKEWITAGTIRLVRFLNASELRPCGGSLFAETMATGTAQAGVAGSEGYGALRTGHLEGSNVRTEEELKLWREIQEWIDTLTTASSGAALPETVALPFAPRSEAVPRQPGTTAPVSAQEAVPRRVEPCPFASPCHTPAGTK